MMDAFREWDLKRAEAIEEAKAAGKPKAQIIPFRPKAEPGQTQS